MDDLTTAQEVFDTVATHLLTQNERSLRPDGCADDCAYRGDKGMKCAVGVLIPDDVYTPHMEGKSISAVQSSAHALGHLRRHMALLLALQQLHDTNLVGDWPRSLRETARFFNLSPHVVASFRLAQQTAEAL